MSENNKNKGYFSSLSGARKAVPILLAASAVFLGICLIIGESGALGQAVSGLLLGLFSFGAYLIPIALLIHAVFYAIDLQLGKLKSRAVFSVITVISASAIEYAIRFFGKELVFAPGKFYLEATNGGFIGSLLGFAFGKLLGSIGVIILFVAIVAVFATFFYADKTGSFGKRVNAIKDGARGIYSGVKKKAKENADNNKKIKEEEAQRQREQVSNELADDDFFKAKGIGSDVKVAKLGIDEAASPTGAANLVHHDAVETPEEYAEIVEEPKERPHRTKPLDLSYGIDDTEVAQSNDEPSFESAPESNTGKTVYNNEFFGLDDSAENVFTKNFEPFDFATSEKLASKPSSRAAVQEELDDITLLEMKGEPTEREKRMMELERKKKLWLEQKERERKAKEPEAPAVQASEPSPAAATGTEPVREPAPKEPEISQPARAEEAVSAPSTVGGYSAPAKSSVPSGVNTYTSYSTTQTTYTAPIKTVEFTIGNDTKSHYDEPKESAPVEKANGDSPRAEQSAEEVAVLIAQKIARSNPAYARSANEMKTYTTVISSGDDELYQPKEASVAPAEPTPVEPEVHAVEFTEDKPAESSVASEETYTFGDVSAAPAEEKNSYERAAEFVAAAISSSEPTPAPAMPDTPVVPAAPEAPVVPEAPVEPEAPVASEFKAYSAPAVPTAEVESQSSLTVEREMLAPAAVASTVAEKTEDIAPAENLQTPTVEQSEPEFVPVEEADDANKPSASESDFEWTTDGESKEESTEEESAEFIEFSDEEIEEEPEVAEELATVEEPGEEVETAEEIPPEEQNPDVIKLREMFPFLAPLNEEKPTEPAPEIMPKEEDDLPPFDKPVEVKSAPIKENLAPVPAKPEPKKPDYADYEFPSIELLAKEESNTDENIQAEIQENADKLIETLASFNVTASIKGVDRGPRITRYEVVPAKGVKVSSILNLQDDIALNLAAGSIRMEAPIPGKSAVGIEIPNKKSSTVRLRNLLETEEFQSNKSKTAVCIGRDVAGQPVFGDIAKMPHLLIAGATGMGKSVCINSLLISILYKARPDEVKLIMIDPKQVEFTMYNGIPHLLVPVVSDAKQAAGALMWAVEEMERRYNLLNPLCVRNIEAYNEKVSQDRSLGEPMPRIIIVIDEFADLMLQVKDPVETLVMRIAQKARAAGIYLVIGTQRPSVNVITGVIKANVPSRISCKVMSNVDSKTVLDSAGAEKLLDRGDMLYAPAGSPKPHRVQGAFVADGEVESIMQHLKKFSDGASYDSTVMEEIERAAQKCSKKGGGSSDYDDGDGEIHGEGYLNDRQFLDAVEVAVNTRKISTSLIQRKLSIGYGKAAKFIDIMEDMGIVGEANGQRPREVLITPDEWREKLARATLD